MVKLCGQMEAGGCGQSISVSHRALARRCHPITAPICHMWHLIQLITLPSEKRTPCPQQTPQRVPSKPACPPAHPLLQSVRADRRAGGAAGGLPGVHSRRGEPGGAGPGEGRGDGAGGWAGGWGGVGGCWWVAGGWAGGAGMRALACVRFRVPSKLPNFHPYISAPRPLSLGRTVLA